MNQVVIIGRLTKDMELRHSQDGKAFGTFDIAVNRDFDREKTDFFKCVCFGKTAENASKFIGKGSQVGISGSIQNNNYTDKDGVKHYGQNIIVNRIEFLSTKENVKKEEDDFPLINDSEVPF